MFKKIHQNYFWCFLLISSFDFIQNHKFRHKNILFIVADDLG